MSSDRFTKENLDAYLRALAKEFRRRSSKSMPAEIVLVGGAAILTNYGFRDMTSDIDAVIHAASSMQDAIRAVGDRFDLPIGWLNADFMRTRSYTPKLNEFSVFYKSFSGVLSVRTVTAEYLVAMKLCAGRKYKNDLSDVIGILAEHEKRGAPLSFEKIDAAVKNLYGGWNALPEEARPFLENALANGDFAAVYASVREEEAESGALLRDFENTYPSVTKASNVDEILALLQEKRNRQ